MDEATANRIASPFGGGIARQGETCGAVTGALMVLGLRFGPQAGEGKDAIYAKSQQLLGHFREQHGSILCKQLIRFDISQAVELQRARDRRVFQEICPNLVRTAARLVQNMLNPETNTTPTNPEEQA